MITVDNQELNWKKPVTSTEKWAAGEIDKLLKNKKRIVFERMYSHKDLGIVLSNPQTIYDLMTMRNDPESRKKEKWVLSDPSLLNSTKKIYEPKHISSGLDIDINVQDDPEMAFFMYVIFQRTLGTLGYKIQDYDIEAEQSNAIESLKMHAGYIIMSKLSDDGVMLRCHALGIETNDKGMARLRKELLEKVTSLNKNPSSGMTYSKFIQESEEDSDELLLQAYVNDAFKKGIIEIQGLQIKYKDSGSPMCIIPAQRINEVPQVVVDYLLKHETEKEIFMSSIQGVIEDIAVLAGDYNNINNVAQLKSIIRKISKATVIPDKTTARELKDIIKDIITQAQ
jgi:hypothetical protein